MAKSEALDNIYSFFKQNIKSGNAKRGRHATPENRWKTTIGLISKNNFARAAHFFSTFFLPLFCTTTTWNFQRLRSYTFYGGNVVGVSVHFFSLPLISTLHWWPLALLILSTPLHKIFMLFFPQKNVSFGFSSLTLNPCRPFSLSCPFLVELRWPAAHFLFFSVFLLLYIPNFWTWQFILV